MHEAHEQEYVEYVSARLPGLRRLAYLLCGDAHRADDLVQQALITLFVRWRRARTVEHLDAYVRRMLLRVFLGERRRVWAQRVDLTGAVPDRVAAAADPDDRTVLRTALAQVPPRQRAVLVLRFLYDLPVDEVAALLDCSPGTVKSQTAHGLGTLRRLLADRWPAASGRTEVAR